MISSSRAFPQDLSRKGFLQKKGKDGKWKQRYCHVNGNFLNIYNSQSLNELLSVVDLSQVNDIITAPFSRTSDPFNRGSISGYNIRIEFSEKASKPITLKSLTLEDAVEWVEVLRNIKEKIAPKSWENIPDIITLSSHNKCKVNLEEIPTPNAMEDVVDNSIIDESSNSIAEDMFTPTPPTPDSNKPKIFDTFETNQTRSNTLHGIIAEGPRPKDPPKPQTEYMHPWPIILILTTIIVGCIWTYLLYADQIPVDHRQPSYVYAGSIPGNQEYIEFVPLDSPTIIPESTSADDLFSAHSIIEKDIVIDIPLEQPYVEVFSHHQEQLQQQQAIIPYDESNKPKYTRKAAALLLQIFTPLVATRRWFHQLTTRIKQVLISSWKKLKFQRA